MPDQQSVREAFAHSTIFSAMDLKAGFQNVPVAENTKPLLGLVTQDGLFQWERMAFGLVGAPMHFQFIIDTLLA